MGIAETLAHGPAYFGSFTGAHPDDRVCARDIRELELINTGFCIFGFFGGGVIEWRHVFGPTNLFKFMILVMDAPEGELFLTTLRGHGVSGYGRVSLADVPGGGKYFADGIHLFIGQAMHTPKLFEQDLVLFFERLTYSRRMEGKWLTI